MKRLFSVMFACLLMPMALAACETFPNASTPPPAPGSVTLLDDKVVTTAFTALDVVVDEVTKARQSGAIVPGSDRAVRIAAALDTARHALNAASAAQRAGQSASYAEAFANAHAAFLDLKAALGK